MAKIISFCFYIVIASTAYAQQGQEYRFWSDASNTIRVKALIVGLSADQTAVTLRREDGKTVSVPLVRLSDADRTYALECANSFTANPFHSADLLVQEQANTSKLPLSVERLLGEENSKIVLAEGVGVNAEESLKDAFREAVRQVVGAYVDAETQVHKDDLIEDRVLTYSSGYIKRYVKISDSERSGLVRTKIQALVLEKKLVEKLRTESISVRTVDSKSLFAEALTKSEKLKDATALVNEVLKELPIGLLVSKQQGEPAVEAQGDGKVRAGVLVEVKVDEEAYRSFSKRFIEVLGHVSEIKGTYILTCVERDKVGDKTLFDRRFYGRDDFSLFDWMPNAMIRPTTPPGWPGLAKPVFNPKFLTVAVASDISADGRTMKWSYFCVDKLLAPVLERYCSQRVRLFVEFKDMSGAILDACQLDVTDDPKFGLNANPLVRGRDFRFGNSELLYLVSPTFTRNSQQYFSYTQGLSFEVVTQLATDEVAKISEIRFELSSY